MKTAQQKISKPVSILNNMYEFQNRQVAIVTKHGKEEVIAPLLENSFGVKTYVPNHYDTDVLGTFTGEIERKADVITTLRNKCNMAIENHDGDLFIANEGSFGPHPDLIFANVDEEFLILVDRKNDFEVIVREVSTRTNFNGDEIKSFNQLKKFARQVYFPSHALILRDQKNSNIKIIKGITEWKKLAKGYEELMRTFGTVYAETDMRAMYNPTRMSVIKQAAEKLIAKINSRCPECGIPGFGVTDIKSGLPCSLCCSPTASTLSHIYSCSKCKYTLEKEYPNERFFEEPMYCNFCNP